MTQSFNIPDSISSDALQAHLDTLVDQDSADQFPDDLFELAEHWVKQSIESTDNPMMGQLQLGLKTLVNSKQ
jgi:hypothetical protein